MLKATKGAKHTAKPSTQNKSRTKKTSTKVPKRQLSTSSSTQHNNLSTPFKRQRRGITTTTTTINNDASNSKLPADGLTLGDFMSKSPHDEHDPEVSHLGCIPTSISPSDIPDEPLPDNIPVRKPKQKVAKPTWLKAPLPRGEQYEHLRETVKGLGLATVCQEARCPNIGECWGGKKGVATATIMLLGDTCTRGCRFCAVKTSRTPPEAESDEPEKTSSAILKWGLEYVVFTMVARDDIPDGGAAHVARTVKLLKDHHKPPLVEALTSDFQGSFESVKAVVESGLDVFAHNVETVRELQHVVRDRRTSMDRSLDVLKYAKQVNPDIITKTSLMLGCGETDEEIVNTLKELRQADVNVVTFGQYLQPTSRHMKVVDYVTPEKFEHWQKVSEEMGFLYVASGPMVRSSYRAGEYFITNVIEKRKAAKLEAQQQQVSAFNNITSGMATPQERLGRIDQALKQLEATATQIYVTLGEVPPQFNPKPVNTKGNKQPQQQQQPQGEGKAKQPKPQATASKQSFQYDEATAIERYHHDQNLPPNMVCCTTTNYTNSVTNTVEDIEKALTPNEKRMRQLVFDMANDNHLQTSIFYRAPSDYYDWTLNLRRNLLGAPSIHYLCKTMLMRNSKCPHEDYSNPMDSKYYFCIIQYSARLHNDKIGHAIRRLHPETSRPPSKNFNFRWTDEEVSAEITGQEHNGVTPLGTRNKVPIVLSHKIAMLPQGYIWLGGGEVDLKWRISVADFVKYFNPIIDDITYDEPSHDDKDFE